MVDHQTDQAAELHEVMRASRVRELCAQNCPTVPHNSTIAFSADALRSNDFGCVVVVEDDRPIGIFTERDWLRTIARRISLSEPVIDAMASPPVTISVECSVLTAVQLMAAEHCRRLPVVDSSGRAVGILDVHEVLNFFAELYPRTIFSQAPRLERGVFQREGA